MRTKNSLTRTTKRKLLSSSPNFLSPISLSSLQISPQENNEPPSKLGGLLFVATLLIVLRQTLVVPVFQGPYASFISDDC
jgi:hypothetical protein